MFNRDSIVESVRDMATATLTKSARRLREQTRRITTYRAAAAPFAVRYLGMTDDTVLSCTLDVGDGRMSDPRLVVAGTAHPPVEQRGRFVRFEIDVANLLHDEGFDSAGLSVHLDGDAFALPYVRSRELDDEPWNRPQAWLGIESNLSGSRLIRLTAEVEVVVTSLVSTATGIRFTTNVPATITFADGDGNERRCMFDGGEHHLDLASLAHRGVPGPTFWRATALLSGADVKVVVNNRDLVDPSTAYSVPMLITRDGDRRYYAKPYFARRTGQLSIRTGIRAEPS